MFGTVPALRTVVLAEQTADDEKDVLEGLLHYRLFNEAERVRWRMEDIPWSSIDRSKITPSLVSLVHQIVLAELTTYSATRRFLQEFSEDIDFTQWMSIWFYEETKHPHALVRWLHEAGRAVSGGEIVRGRITAPFMKSRFGMLVTNIISEVHASATYVALTRTTEEPVLRQIARHLGGDEARHATGFFAYAQRAYEQSKNRDAERLDALKVLHMWLNQNGQVQHPVNTVGLRTSGDQELLEDWSRATTDQTIVEQHSLMQQRITRERILGLIGNLTEMELKTPEQVLQRIRELKIVDRKAS
ncbi:ferritin-like domain-containing protein [Sorangium sp. So ce1000]|uniref:ferritin-like domain-containing protein n=1 Tax=Sorangium sp. So ce1000 TaxID=3133325 RepID=UPI003F61EDC8